MSLEISGRDALDRLNWLTANRQVEIVDYDAPPAKDGEITISFKLKVRKDVEPESMLATIEHIAEMAPIKMCEPEDYAALRRMAARLCGGSDKMRDEGNLLVVLLDRFV